VALGRSVWEVGALKVANFQKFSFFGATLRRSALTYAELTINFNTTYGALLVFQISELQLFQFLFHERSNMEKNSKIAPRRFWSKMGSSSTVAAPPVGESYQSKLIFQ